MSKYEYLKNENAHNSYTMCLWQIDVLYFRCGFLRFFIVLSRYGHFNEMVKIKIRKFSMKMLCNQIC